jgi:hypothetical protein
MKRFAAVALREIVERRFVLVAAGVAAVIPFLVPLLPGVPSDQSGLTRGITALILACSFGLGGSLLVGASVVGRELAERRLSFHFSHPLAGPVVWGGKLAGGLALVLLAELIVFLPSSVASGRFPGLWGSGADAGLVWAILLSAVPLFLFSWLGSVALRSRSPWLIADLVLIVAFPAALFVVSRRFLRYGGWFEPVPVISTAIGVLVAALLFATFAQVVVGRTDARRGHGAQSLVLWGLLLAATAAGTLWAERTIDPGVGRLVRAWAQPSGSNGEWAFVQGSARKAGAGGTNYLLNLMTGRSLLLPLGWTATVSADGSRAAYVHVSPFSKEKVELEAIDLNTGDSVTLDLPDWPEGVDLTADGRRLAVVSQGLCSVVELPSLRLLASARVPSSPWAYVPQFVSPETVRLHPLRSFRRSDDRSGSTTRAIEDPEAAELHVTKKSVTTLAHYPIASIEIPARKEKGVDSGPVFSLVPGPDLSRVLVIGAGTAYAVRLLDAASGRILASVDGSEELGRPTGIFLADGRAVLSEPIPEGRRLVLLSPDGTRLAEIALPPNTSSVGFGPEPGKGLLSVGLASGKRTELKSWYLVDLQAGSLRPLEDTVPPYRYWIDGLSYPPPGSPVTHLALDGDRRVILFDPMTSTTTPLTRGWPAGK